ncbi:ABC transporter permease [Catenulispora sp. NF23]|uniref:Transport permease protein n=1 Tax=Catenulispora pinistramenti TaxID=2705254 RepID=A0ABS5L0C8_9ACTN|nr:ABC transporter permease [Catenulispora pinistramenti]MBS2535146.1 ABC transporter permease [Catenulispora pinistramenti]MBS2551695.1 ABC transporter permease [Catenulispora pinistramenti]
MSTPSTALGDSAIMLRRNFRHTVRNPVTVFNAILFPIVMMLMFVYVFGGAFKVPGSYVDYAVPGLIVMAITYGLGPTATSVNDDMTKGIINRFKTMDVSRGAVLTGHVVATTVRSVIAVGAIIGVGFAMGFRSHGSLLDWLGAIGLVLLLAFATSWLTVAMGLSAKSVESAGLATVPLIMLPFLSSAFVPASTMKTGVKQFAEYQPFTPIIETLRGLLSGGHVTTSHTVQALAWCVGFAVLGYLWAVSTFKKRA